MKTMNVLKSFLLTGLFIFLPGAAVLVMAQIAQAQTDKSAPLTTMTEAQIDNVLETANDGEVDLGKIAIKKSKNTHVQSFADLMVREHKKNNDERKAAAKKDQIKGENNDVSKVIKKDAKNKVRQLKKANDAEFDRMYLESQITMHQQLLNDLDQKFIPTAQSPQFKAYLQKTRDHIQEHLAKAQELQAATPR